jgi:ABC-type amino acid transport system permease subunit
LDCTFQFGEVPQHWPLLLEGAVNTLRLSLVGMSIGLVVGIAGGAARNSSLAVLGRRRCTVKAEARSLARASRHRAQRTIRAAAREQPGGGGVGLSER